MFDYENITGKNIMIVGLGKTGVALAHFLVKRGARVTISDHKSKAELLELLERLEDLPISYDLSGHTPKLFLKQDLIILSPGVSPHLKIFDYARSSGVTVTGEFEFSASQIKEPVIAVTGTNGKTTVSQLISLFLNESGISCWVGGNYGDPISDYLNRGESAKVVVAEASSFQLEHCEQFKPKTVVFTNLVENHLDRYRSMEEYINSKRKVFKNIDSNVGVILNADDNAVIELARDPAVYQRALGLLYFSRKPPMYSQVLNIGGAVLVDNEIHVCRSSGLQKINLKNMKLKGDHAVENIMAAVLSSFEYGATTEGIQKVVDSFEGLEHRLEYICRVGGVEFYNDSKSTNPHSVMRALDSFNSDVVLIMGGKDTSLNYEVLKDRIRTKVKTLILVGEAKEQINRHIGDYSETFLIGTFEEAVLIAYQKSHIGDTVLLSPGCPSFDIFDSYEERGNYFKSIVSNFR